MPTITIDLTAPQAQRVQDAFEYISNGQPVTIDTARGFLVAKLIQKVKGIETEKAKDLAAAGITDLDVV